MKKIIPYICIIGFGFSIAYNANLFGVENKSQLEPMVLEIPKPTMPEFSSIIDLNSGKYIVNSNTPFVKTEVKVNQPIKKEVKYKYKTIYKKELDTITKISIRKETLPIISGRKLQVRKIEYPTRIP